MVEGQSPSQAANSLFVMTAVIMVAHMGMAALANHLNQRGVSLNQAMHWGLAAMAVFSGSAVLGLWPDPLMGWSLAFLAAGVTTVATHGLPVPLTSPCRRERPPVLTSSSLSVPSESSGALDCSSMDLAGWAFPAPMPCVLRWASG